MNMPNDSNPFADSDLVQPSLANSSDHVENPYASPREISGSVTPEVGLWRDGTLMVAHRDVIFPHFCVRTNEPSERGFRCHLTWSYPIDFSSRSVRFEVGLCERCIRRYRKFRWVGWGVMIAAFGVGLVAPHGTFFIFAAASLFVVGLFLATRPGVSLKVKRGSPPYFWIRGAHRDFLARLPPWTAR